MQERMKLIRKHFNMTQEEFADALGIKRGAISNYEIGRNEPIDAVISLICTKFDVNEEWLRYGTGEMLTNRSRQEEISRFLSDTLHSEPDDFKARFVAMLARLDADDWKVLAKMAQLMLDERNEKE